MLQNKTKPKNHFHPNTSFKKKYYMRKVNYRPNLKQILAKSTGFKNNRLSIMIKEGLITICKGNLATGKL